MIAALQRLGGMEPGALPQNMAASGIAGGKGLMSMFATHPPALRERIAALKDSDRLNASLPDVVPLLVPCCAALYLQEVLNQLML